MEREGVRKARAEPLWHPRLSSIDSAIEVRAGSRRRHVMSISRKTLSFVAFLTAMTPALCPADATKAWPTRHVRIIVPFAAGGAQDAAARLYADGLSRCWSQPVVIENRPGA